MRFSSIRYKTIVTKPEFFINGLLWISILCIMIGVTGCVRNGAQDGMLDSKVDVSATDGDILELTSKYKPVYSITLGSGEVVTQADYLAKQQPLFLFFFSPN